MEPTWQILPDPLTPGLNEQSYEQSLNVADTQVVSGGQYIGTGLLRPLRRSLNGDFLSGSGLALIRAGVGLILGTSCTSEISDGELPWRTEFGSVVQRLRLQPNDANLRDLARVYVIDAISRWMTAVRITDVNVIPIAGDALVMTAEYNIVDPGSGRVLVPGIQTSVQVG